MSLSPEQLLGLYSQRAKMYAPLHATMSQISDIYGGRTQVELPDADEVDPAAVPNLLAQGLDQLAGRTVSVNPMWLFAPEDATLKRDRTRAKQAANVCGAWYMLDRQPLRMRQRARHLLAYAMAPAIIRWDAQEHRPIRETRSPLETYPSPETVHGTAIPTDCLFAYRRSIGWLVDHGYENQVRYLMRQRDLDRNWEMLLIEYVDLDGRMLVLAGAAQAADPYMPIDPYYSPATEKAALLAFSPSAGAYDTPMVSVPTRLTLDKPMGQFDTMVSTYFRQAKILALELAAVEKGIWPDTFLNSDPGRTAHFLDPEIHDGRTGLVNVIIDGKIQEVNSNPGYQTPTIRDYLERNMRITAGIPSEFGGESGTNIRTGRRGDAVMSAVIDFPLAEAQDIFSYALADEDKCMIALAKAHEGNTRRTFYVGVGNTMRPVSYIANEVFTHDEHVVSYPLSGTDINSLRVGLGQAHGMGTMSTRTAMELDPMISDPELEHDRIIGEGMEQALVASIQQQIAGGQIAPLTGARIYELIVNDKLEPFEALQKATQEATQEATAAQAPTGPAGPPTPESLAAPGAVQALTGGTIGPSTNQVGLAQLLRTLHTPQTAAGAPAGP